jgi:Zn-dependent protease/CBS domain-containing protein
MRSGTGFRIASILGIPIHLDLSFFVSFALISAIFGLSVLPDEVDPVPGDVERVGLSLVAGLIFFVSLLLHELAHSVLARWYGLRVRNITLFLLGGVSQITEDTKTARQEFLIAFVGPATSAVLGGIFLAVAIAFTTPETAPAAVLGWLGVINLILAAFNMLPGFPLDGGRVFRSLLWGITRSRTRATRYASRVGQAFGAVMALGGLALLVIDIGDGSGGLGGFWFFLIGAFLYNAAAQNHRAAVAEERLTEVLVRDVMSTDLRTIEVDTMVRFLVPERDRIDHTAAFLVTSNERVVGLLTGAQIALLDEDRYRSATVGEVMVDADAIAPIAPTATGHEALERLQASKTPILPVVEHGRLLGLVGLEQMLAALRKRPQPRPVG